MIEVANSVGWTVSFDGRVIESFSNDNTRIHINNVKKIELKEGRKGTLGVMVSGRWGGGFLMTDFDPGKRSALEDLVAQVNAARAASGMRD